MKIHNAIQEKLESLGEAKRNKLLSVSFGTMPRPLLQTTTLGLAPTWKALGVFLLIVVPGFFQYYVAREAEWGVVVFYIGLGFGCLFGYPMGRTAKDVDTMGVC